jgi:hypothetical protein
MARRRCLRLNLRNIRRIKMKKSTQTNNSFFFVKLTKAGEIKTTYTQGAI